MSLTAINPTRERRVDTVSRRNAAGEYLYKRKGKPFFDQYSKVRLIPSDSDASLVRPTGSLTHSREEGPDLTLGVMNSPCMRIWSSLDKNAQLGLEQSSTAGYWAQELTWTDYLPRNPLKRQAAPPPPVTMVASAIDRLSSSSTELCQVIRNTSDFVYDFHTVTSQAIQQLEAVGRNEMTAKELRPVLSSAISQQLNVAGAIELRLLTIIKDLGLIQADSQRNRDLKGEAANSHSCSVGLPLYLAKIASGLGTIMAMAMITERSAALATGSDYSFDTQLAVVSGVLTAASGMCGAQVKTATEYKKLYEEECSMLTATWQQTTDTLQSTQGYTRNFQILRADIVELEKSLWNGTPRLLITDHCLRLQRVFDALSKEGLIAQGFMDYYGLPVARDTMGN
ncbi:hypothetical protein FRB96_001730 [Tulasnella sp. 330]|nr:hypothetical protein FRB96_001730 [Tulasnella sp. 330]KAG8886828.1 hypothetical protein FRB98_000964 [Tulasnella sp. 332]